jgi:PAS domain S-box-containing protein
LSLTLRLFLLALFAAVPAVLIQAWNEYDLRQARTVAVREQVLRLAQSQNAEIERLVEGARQFLVALAQLPPVKSKDAAACNELLARIRENYRAYRALIAADADGNVFCSSVGPGPNIADRAYFRRAMSSGDLSIGEYAMGRRAAGASIHFSYPVYADGGPISGVIAAALDLDWFAARLGEKLPLHAVLEIADRNGTILVRLPDNDAWRGRALPEQVRAIADAPEPGTVDVVRDGVSYVLGYVPLAVPQIDFHVAVAVERNAAFADLHRASERGIILIALALSASLLTGLFWAQYGVRRPMQELLGLVGRWRAGNYVPRSRPWSGTELGRLGQAFDDLARTVSQRERQLREREKYLSIVLDRVPAGIMQNDAKGRYVYVNKTFCELTGRSADDLIGRDFRDFTHPGDVAINSELFQRAIEAGEPYVLRKRYLRPDNSVIWAEVTVARLEDGEGVLATATDLTERLRAEAQQGLLVNELNHRVKNTLALVQSLASMTQRHTGTPEQFYQAFSARLRALSLTHNLLTDGLWESVSLLEMLVAELQPYGGDKLDTVSLRGEPIKLKAQHAISLGMVFHELAANAAKYGALSTPSGRIAVEWKVSPNGEGRRLTLEWREHEGPAVVPPTHTGFGTRLIDQTARGAGGKVEFDFAPDGLRCTITLPLE